MRVEPIRLDKLKFGGCSYKTIARMADRSTHSIKAWIIGGKIRESRTSVRS